MAVPWMLACPTKGIGYDWPLSRSEYIAASNVRPQRRSGARDWDDIAFSTDQIA
jgi:hypothetical protein